MSNLTFDGQKKGERIIALWRQHPWVLFKTAAISILLIFIGSIPLANSLSWGAKALLFFIAIAGLYCLLGLYLWFNTIYILTDERILTINQERIFIRTTNEIPLQNIQNVAHQKKGISQTLMNYGTVEVQTAGAVSAMKLKCVENPYKIQQKILTAEKIETSS